MWYLGTNWVHIGKAICVCVCVFLFNIPPTAKVIWRWGHSLKSHPTDWRSWGSNMGSLGTRQMVYRLHGVTTAAPVRLRKILSMTIWELTYNFQVYEKYWLTFLKFKCKILDKWDNAYIHLYKIVLPSFGVAYAPPNKNIEALTWGLNIYYCGDKMQESSRTFQENPSYNHIEVPFHPQ